MTRRFETLGYCPICEVEQTFAANSETEVRDEHLAAWMRGALRCEGCRAPPRERSIAKVLNSLRPNWRQLVIHECSPGGWAFSAKLRRECPRYVPTQYDPSFPFGEMHPAGLWRNENIEQQTFEDEAFDIVVMQDVFEHIFQPGKAAREIVRTLRPNGLAVMTVPVVRYFNQSRPRARLTQVGIEHLLPEQYHGNPVGDGRALVTIDWGYDIGAFLSAYSGVPWMVMVIDDMSMGIRDPYNTIVVGWKAQLPDLSEA